MVALRKKGMKDRHWKQISDKVGFKVDPKEYVEGFTFQEALNLGLMDHVETCVDTGEKASKEFNIEVMMNEMKEFWAE